MDALSGDDQLIISKYPLSLDRIRDVLRNGEVSFDTEKPFRELPCPAFLEQPHLFAASIGRLLATLMGHEAAYHLRSKTSNQDVADELNKIYAKIRKGNFDHQHYWPLWQHVVDGAPDVEVWASVLHLIATMSRLTPPTSAAVSFDDTPITRSTSSFQGSEQTKKLLEAGLFYEVQHCTYRDVGHFFPKFFEGKNWTGEVKRIYSEVKRKRFRGQRIDFPEYSTQEKVWEWLNNFQEEFLLGAPNKYHTSQNTSELAGSEARRQLDFFVKLRDASNQHEWKDILIIGEHKQSRSDLKPILLQLSRYVRDVFSLQPTRRFVHGFLLHGNTMELWVFDRSGPYSSGEFDIIEEPEKFIHAIAGYAFMDREQLGLDTSLRSNGKCNFISLNQDRYRKKKRVYLERDPFVIQRAIVCRGTVCYRSKDLKSVVKLSWTSDKRPPEAKHLRLAHKRKVRGVAKLIGQERITSIDELRDGLLFPSQPHRFRDVLHKPPLTSKSHTRTTVSQSIGSFQGLVISQSSLKRKSLIDQDVRLPKKPRTDAQMSKLRDKCDVDHVSEQTTSLYAPRDGKFDNRLFTCLAISPAGRPITKFHNLLELLTALRDAIRAHRSLYFDGKILHRDISENNIIITEPKEANGFTGMLIDLDLAKDVGGERSGARHQTGTMEFMAIQVLRKTTHTYRHDLESFFYVLLWICARRVWELEFQCRHRDRVRESMLRKWYRGSFTDIARSKEYAMGVNGFRELLEEFPPAFDPVKSLCLAIRAILFPLLKDGGLDTGTPSEEEALYEAIDKAYDESISQLTA